MSVKGSHRKTDRVSTPSISLEYLRISSTEVTRRIRTPPSYMIDWNRAMLRLSMNLMGTLMGSPVNLWISLRVVGAWKVDMTLWPVCMAWNM